MSYERQCLHYYWTRFQVARDADRERGEVSATTVVMAAALVALAITVSTILTTRVREKANSLYLG